MKDRILTAKVLNLPVRNPTQNVYARFNKGIESGLKDYMSEWDSQWREFENKALKTRLEEL